jgi:hypothetical protein
MDFGRIVFIGAAALLACSGAAAAETLKTAMTGAAETPAGDPGGKGMATVKVDVAKSEVCYDISVSGIGEATMAHIHKGAAGVAGPVAIPLNPPGADGKVKACANGDAAVVKDIAANPADYYVNVHTAKFPAGAVRGQLAK